MTRQQILEAGTLLAETYGYQGVFKRHISKHLRCGMGTINYHWTTMQELRSAMVRRARALGTHEKIMQAASRQLTAEL
jgi:AcrR family transcriptional regulator